MRDVGVGVRGRRRTWEKSLLDEPEIKVLLNSEQPCIDGCVGEGKCVDTYLKVALYGLLEELDLQESPCEFIISPRLGVILMLV